MDNLIVITSGKGGVGKTSTAINLAAAINYFGRDVLVIDANLTTPNIGIHLNSPEVPINLNHILLEKASPYEAVYEHEFGMKIMPSSLSLKELKKIKPERLQNFKKEFQSLAEYVIIDSAAGLGNEARSAIELSDNVIIITNPEMPALTDALKTIKLSQELKKNILGVIITRVRKNNSEIGPQTVKEMLETKILGMIPEDISMQEALNIKSPVVYSKPKSKAARAYKEIAAKLLNIEYDSSIDQESFIERIIKALKITR